MLFRFSDTRHGWTCQGRCVKGPFAAIILMRCQKRHGLPQIFVHLWQSLPADVWQTAAQCSPSPHVNCRWNTRHWQLRQRTNTRWRFFFACTLRLSSKIMPRHMRRIVSSPVHIWVAIILKGWVPHFSYVKQIRMGRELNRFHTQLRNSIVIRIFTLLFPLFRLRTVWPRFAHTNPTKPAQNRNESGGLAQGREMSEAERLKPGL